MSRFHSTADDGPDLSGRTIVATGATSGFGLETTRALSILYAATVDLPGGSYVDPSGLGYLGGYPTIYEPSRQARDLCLAHDVWDLSVALTGAVVVDVDSAATVA